ncbi:MAG: hypothetical protein QXO75_00045 [Nitrososphaerota archaeon]
MSTLAAGFPPALTIEIARHALGAVLAIPTSELARKSIKYRSGNDKKNEKKYALAALFTGLGAYMLSPPAFLTTFIGYEIYRKVKEKRKKAGIENKLEQSKRQELSNLVQSSV